MTDRDRARDGLPTRPENRSRSRTSERTDTNRIISNACTSNQLMKRGESGYEGHNSRRRDYTTSGSSYGRCAGEDNIAQRDNTKQPYDQRRESNPGYYHSHGDTARSQSCTVSDYRKFDRGSGGNRGGPLSIGPNHGSFGSQENRPARTETEKIELHTNHFELIAKSNWVVFQYHVDFEPEIESRRLRIDLLKQHENLFPHNNIFDGKTLFSLTKLKNEITVLDSFKNLDQQSVKMTIKRVKEIEGSYSDETMRIFNIIFKRCLLNCKYYEFGKDRAYYDFSNMISMENYNLKIASGYKASIDLYGNKLLLCADLAHKLLNLDTVWEVMEKVYRDSGKDGYKQACINKIVGQTVMTSYNKRTYKIDDIEWNISPRDTFDRVKVGSISYLDYYFDNYKIRIRETRQPLLVSMPKEKDIKRGQTGPIFLVPELCIMTGNILLKEFEKDFRMKKDLDSITKLNPRDRYERLIRFLDNVKQQPDAKKNLENWNMEFNSDLLKVNATILAPIPIVFQNQNFTDSERGWNSAIKNSFHLTFVPLSNWVLIYLPRDENKARIFSDDLIRLSNPMQFKVEKPHMYRLPVDKGAFHDLFLSHIKNIISQYNPQMVVCIVPNSNKNTYQAIKRVCCIDYGIPNQIITSNLIDNNNTSKRVSCITKIAIQMNTKLGGEIWGVKIPLANVMFIGMDIYKDSAQKNMSVASFVASINGKQENKLSCTRYYSRCMLQPRGSEFCNGLNVFMMDALAKYNEKNQTLPDRIFIYRDGVSDGQFSTVIESEIPQIKQAFSQISQNYNPKLTVFIVKKRGNTRFFLKGNLDDIKNAPMGTVIDNTITKNTGEFFLISQNANSGTVSPTHYHIIEDTNDLNVDRLQNLTFRLTHMYYNWPGQISVPAPCHYANRLAHLVGETLHKPHASSLDDKLFYL